MFLELFYVLYNLPLTQSREPRQLTMGKMHSDCSCSQHSFQRQLRELIVLKSPSHPLLIDTIYLTYPWLELILSLEAGAHSEVVAAALLLPIFKVSDSTLDAIFEKITLAIQYYSSFIE